MEIVTETERLIIREILPTDVDEMYKLHSDPEVNRFVKDETIKSKKQIIDIINFVRKQYVEYGFGRWAMISKETGEFIGWTGLEFVTKEINNHINYYDLGYRLIKKFWGVGFATESAVASLDYAFN
jgi:RimJ/RimL family protein N-acetyltransferase